METVVESIRVGHLALAVERPLDAEALLDEEAFATDEYLPYWAELWPSGRALAEVLAARASLAGPVLELGCGLGLPSLVAAARGAEVVASDWSEDALALLDANARRNGLALGTTLLDWRAPNPLAGRRFRLVLAADVLYEARNGEALLGALPSLLAPDGEALLADPGRRHAAAFLGAAAAWADVEREPHALLPRGGVHRLRPRPAPVRTS